MKKLLYILKVISKKARQNELMLMSNALTYKLLIAIFPFIIFLMTLMGFLNITGFSEFIRELSGAFPDPVKEIIDAFLVEVIETKRISLLSTSFLISIYSASTGFNSITQGLNRVYEKSDIRPFIIRRAISVVLVFVFAVLVIISLFIFIFSDFIKKIIIEYTTLEFIPYFLDSLFLYIFVACILFIIVMIIYKISIYQKVTLRSIMPGTIFTVSSWLILSKAFNIYINNFSRYSKIYGSIGGIFVLVIWINMISLILLLGGQINALIENRAKYISIEKK